MKIEITSRNKGPIPKGTPWDQQKGMAPKNPGVKVLSHKDKYTKGKTH